MSLKNFLWILPFIFFFTGYQIFNKIFSITEIDVPNVIGKSINEASKILSNNNLNLRILSEKEDLELQEGTITDQTPLNKKIRPNQSIFIVVSKKPKKFKMPNFKMKSLKDIEQQLSKEKLKKKIYYLESDLPENYCISQYPEADREVEDNKIILYLSSGNKKEIIFPNLKNLNLKDVLSFFELNEIKPKLILKNEEEFDHSKNYRILDQKPLAGSILKLNKNLNVQLLVEEN